jgi:hypothetical protein
LRLDWDDSKVYQISIVGYTKLKIYLHEFQICSLDELNRRLDANLKPRSPTTIYLSNSTSATNTTCLRLQARRISKGVCKIYRVLQRGRIPIELWQTSGPVTLSRTTKLHHLSDQEQRRGSTTRSQSCTGEAHLRNPAHLYC